MLSSKISSWPISALSLSVDFSGNGTELAQVFMSDDNICHGRSNSGIFWSMTWPPKSQLTGFIEYLLRTIKTKQDEN